MKLKKWIINNNNQCKQDIIAKQRWMLCYVALTLNTWPLTIPPKLYNCTKFIIFLLRDYSSQFSSIHTCMYTHNTGEVLYRNPITPVTIPFNLFKLPVIKNCWWWHGLLTIFCVLHYTRMLLYTNEFIRVIP